jgi:hypothetical protein
MQFSLKNRALLSLVPLNTKVPGAGNGMARVGVTVIDDNEMLARRHGVHGSRVDESKRVRH